MNRCEVLIPFHMTATNTDHKPGDIIEVSDEQLARIRAVNVNMVLVLVDEKSAEKPKKSRKKQ